MPPHDPKLRSFWQVLKKTLHFMANTAETEPSIIIGLDGCKSGERVRRAYIDPEGLHARFALNALERANLILGYNAFQRDEWAVQGEKDERDEQQGCMYKFLVPLENVLFEGISFKAMERLHITSSYKYDAKDKVNLWKSAGLTPTARWNGDDGMYGKIALPPNASFSHTLLFVSWLVKILFLAHG